MKNDLCSQKLLDAIEIWKSGVKAVDPFKLIQKSVVLHKEGDRFELNFFPLNVPKESSFDLENVKNRSWVEIIRPNEKIIVVGMGKASASMAAGLEMILQPLIDENRVSGWINIPDDPILLKTQLRSIHLHGARPLTLNEPTEQGVWGSRKIVERIQSADPTDLIICLISGGGSALLPLPVSAISLKEKLEITRFLSASGANIRELNIVRKQLSQLKGGGIRRLCRNKRLIGLLLSDVPGDPLDVIASGATVENKSSAKEALAVLQKFQAQNEPVLSNIYSFIYQKARFEAQNPLQNELEDSNGFSRHHHFIIGNNQTAVWAAAKKAKELGYSPFLHSVISSEGDAETIGERLLTESLSLFENRPILQNSYLLTNSSFANIQNNFLSDIDMSCDNLFDNHFSDSKQSSINIQKTQLKKISKMSALINPSNVDYNCVISGGEPVVHLISDNIRGKGGRNQQLVLAAFIEILKKKVDSIPVFLSGGTDGEDGPTDAAGAFFDQTSVDEIRWKIQNLDTDPEDFLQRNDAWTFFEQFDALLKTGPTGTNVCDLRVILKGN